MEHKLKFILLLVSACFSSLGFAAKTVSGTVVDDQNQPLPGVAVMVPGTTRGTVTDFDGNYSISLEDEDAELSFSFIGYENQTIAIGSQSVINASMASDAIGLDEVVAVGYGTQKKKLVTGATVQVKGDEIAKLSTSNALTAMQASTPGVQITQASAQPGKGFKVNIRGVGTMGTSSPLLVIDGISSGTADDGLNGLNPNEIESIDVLKDAASCAIYGVAAANGVILVTTKQGKAGKMQVSYDAYVGVSNPAKRPATLNAQEYMKIVNESNFNTYGTATDWSKLVSDEVYQKLMDGWEGTDWFEEYRNENAVQQNHSLNITGGNDRSKFSLSLGFTQNDGTMGADNASDYRRYTGRINSEHVIIKAKKGFDAFTIGENLSYWFHSSHDMAEGNGYWNMMQPVYTASPVVPAYTEDGELTSYTNNGAGFNTMIFSNPLQGLMNGQYSGLNRSRDFGVGATFYFEIQPIKDLKYKFSFNTGYSASNSRTASQPYSVSSTNASSTYSVTQSQSQSGSYMFNQTLSYKLPTFAKNNIDIMVGQEFSQSDWSVSQSASASTTSSNSSFNTLLASGFAYQWLSNYTASDITGFSGAPGLNRALNSLFGRINWNFDEKYMATFTMRADESSRFSEGNRWGYFPSVSAGWVVSQESFMNGTKSWLDVFKIRASWGQNGNDNIDDLQYTASIAMSPTDYADYAYKFSSDQGTTLSSTGYQSGAFTENVANEDVTWETSEQINIGFDSKFLGGRLGLNFDWYQKKTKDWLVQAPIELTMGVGSDGAPYVNGGDIENKGIEIALSWHDTFSNGLGYHVNVNFATNKNEVTRLEGLDYINGSDGALFENSSYVSRVEVGHPIGYFYGMSYSGIWQTQDQIDQARNAGQAVLSDAQPGDMIWDDYDGDGTINYDNDRHEIGDPHPQTTLGVSLGLDFMGFDFSVTGSGQFGMQIMQCYRTALLANQYLNYTQDVFNRWHGEGTSNTDPILRTGSTNDQWVSTRYMKDADFFRIQNITLGYDFAKLIKGKSPFSQIRLFVQAQNVYTFTDYSGVDPEVGSSGGNDSWASGIDVGLYPSSRTFLAGVNVKF